jgi:membrane protein YdbS with pleckstrin-like domain
MSKIKRLLLELWRDLCVFILSFAIFAHVYWLFQTNKWWSITWDAVWVVAYIITIVYIVFKSNLLEEKDF